MSKYAPETFISFLDKNLTSRGWSDYKLSKLAGISHSVISRARSGIPPGWEACKSIAEALEVPKEDVLRAAGHLDEKAEDDPLFSEFEYMLENMTDDEREEMLAYGRMKLELRKKREEEAAGTKVSHAPHRRPRTANGQA